MKKQELKELAEKEIRQLMEMFSYTRKEIENIVYAGILDEYLKNEDEGIVESIDVEKIGYDPTGKKFITIEKN